MLIKNLFKIGGDKVKEGTFGVEIEVEGSRLPKRISKWWSTHADGSLRGDSCEYVLSEPLNYYQTLKAISYLKCLFNKRSSKINNSVRAGVHVHINVQNKTLLEVINIITMYYIFEEVLVRWCGEHRQGNLFCLRGCDADWVVNLLCWCIRKKDYRPLNTDEIRYASLNLSSVHKYGSLEFRPMRTTDNFKDVYNWLRLLSKIVSASKHYHNPIEIIEDLNSLGVSEFSQRVFGTMLSFLDLKNLPEDVESGKVNALDVAYSINDWEGYFEVSGNNPFKKTASIEA